LYDKWATIERFQKTRGVLRLMAGVAYHLWINGDASCMIMPGSIPLSIPQIKEELTRYLPENWNAIVDSEIDGKDSMPMKLDKENTRYGAVMAARRVARTIFMGSAPSVRERNIRGINENHIRLGTIQPHEEKDIAVFGDILGKLKSTLAYLYSDNNAHLWYDNRPTLRKVVQDLESRILNDVIEEEIEKRLRKWKSTADFGGIHICPNSSDVPDEQSVRLVILPIGADHERGQSDTAALQEAQHILETRGNTPRQYKNTLVFLAPDNNKMFDLKKITKRYKAWQLVLDESDSRNLDQAQKNEAKASIAEVEKTLNIRFTQSYSWLFAPYIDTESSIKDIKWQIWDISCENQNNVEKAASKLVDEDCLIPVWGAALLKMELDNWLWKDRDHIEIKQLWNYLTSYCYLPRLKDINVLLTTVKKGVKSKDGFAIAEAFQDGRYVNLRIGEEIFGEISLHELIVKAEVARKQIDEDEKQNETSSDDDEPNSTNTDEGQGESNDADAMPKIPQKKNRHFSMDVPLDSVRINKDVSTYMDEIISHLMNLPGARAEIRLDVDIEVPDGAPSNVVTTVSENCRTLKIDNFHFEE
ncbi:MAG: DUF499 domain-containing protein, partial [Selenomonadaceae bacterium]|nr:DUF499 domain-containing protein [Selenomonadaceae bacterium]